MTAPQSTPVALITGGSQGLGLELVKALAGQGWTVITDSRNEGLLVESLAAIEHTQDGSVTGIAGDIGDSAHRSALVAAATSAGRLDLLVHNASTLGPTPLRPLQSLGTDELLAAITTNVGAPHALTTALLPLLTGSGGALLSMSSDAAIEHYQGWGAYGASKAALDHLILTFAAENPAISGYAIDPGDMRTQMHQDAFAGQDISNRPLPAVVVPQLLALLAQRPASGRYRAADFAPTEVGATS